MSFLKAVPEECMERAPLIPAALPSFESMKLRPYQAELIAWAFSDFRQGVGTLAYLPTGTGKTLVAALTCSVMQAANPHKKVLFVVDKVPLMQQQAAYLEGKAGLPSVAICGATPKREELLQKPFDVLVATAQVLAGMFQRDELRPAQFSLLVLDEAHHCTGEHPYTSVMREMRMCPAMCRPRFLGLSATPTSGNPARSLESSLTELEESLGAQLRAPILQKHSLEEALLVPEHTWLHSSASASMQEFQKMATRGLGILERTVASALGTQPLHIRIGGEAAAGPGSDGLAGLGDCIQRQRQVQAWQLLRSYCMAHQPELLSAGVQLAVVLAEAADVCGSLGDAHGRAFLQRSGSLQRETSMVPHACQRILQDLAAWDHCDAGDAPHFVKVLDLVRARAAAQGDAFRGIIFVETRTLARQLAELLRHRLVDLEPLSLVGSGGTDEGPRRPDEQEAVLARFRTGETRLLVATSVAEEGLDVADCSLVVRLQGVRSFASHVQSRGRARAASSSFVVVGSENEEKRWKQLHLLETQLRDLATSRMEGVPAPLRAEVGSCADQMLQGAAASPPGVDLRHPENIWDSSPQGTICIVAHGLRSSLDEDLLCTFGQVGAVLGCFWDNQSSTGLPDKLRPVGESVLVQLRPVSKAPNVTQMLTSLARRSPGTWFRQQGQVPQPPRRGTCNCTLEVGSFLGGNVFARQAILHGTTMKVSEYQRAVWIRMPWQDPEDDKDALCALQARAGMANLADNALVHMGADGVVIVFLLLKQPPKFWLERSHGDKYTRKRSCMPPTVFGGSFVYAFRFRSEQAAYPFKAFLAHNGIRLCYTCIHLGEHNLHVPEFPNGCGDEELDAGVFDWEEGLEGDDSAEDKDLRDAGRVCQLLRTLSGQEVRVSPAAAAGDEVGPAMNFEVLYALLCALGEEPLLLASALTPPLRRQLSRLVRAKADVRLVSSTLPRLLDGRLFACGETLAQSLALEAEQQRDSGVTPGILASPKYVAVRNLIVTPTRFIFQPPQELLSNRVLREFGEVGANDMGCTADRFLRVHFRDEDGHEFFGDAFAPRMKLLFDRGLRIGDRHYRYLHWSNSQLRTGSLWMYAARPGGPTCADIRAWVCEDPAKLATPSKYASRLALFFSSGMPTINIEDLNVRIVDDVETPDKKFCFTDGAGRIRQDIAEQVAKKLGLTRTPSAFQIRYGGAKGVVVAYPSSTCKAQLELRPSMVKFDSEHDSFEVLAWSGNNTTTLNQQIILLLAARGVKSDTFLELQEKTLLESSEIVVDLQRAARRLTKSYRAVGASITDLLAARVDLTSEAFFASLLRHLYRQDVQRLRRKSAIPLQQAANLVGVPDETQTLNYGEVFIQISRFSGQEVRRHVVQGDVVVTKNPCLHPGDILRLRAVDCKALHGVVDCVVFPVKGPRPHPNEISGSDLDGDLYFCSWRPDLMPDHTWEPMNFESRDELEAVAEHGVGPEHMRDYFVRVNTSTSLGQIANAHRVHADRKGAASTDCLRLAMLHSEAVDAPKTGRVVDVPPELKLKSFPAWLEKKGEEEEDDDEEVMATAALHVSPADTLLQQLHDQCPKVAAVSPDDRVPIDPWFVLPGHEAFLEEARRLRDEYNAQLFQLIRRHGARWEAEVLAGSFEQRPGAVHSSLEDRIQIEHAAVEAYRILAMHYRQLFISQLPAETVAGAGGLCRETTNNLQKKASAWYVAAYSKPFFRGRRLLSFGWLMSDHLLTIPRPDQDAPDQSGVAAVPEGRLHDALAASIADVFRRQECRQDHCKHGVDALEWRVAKDLAAQLRRLDPELVVEPLGLGGLGLCSLPGGASPADAAGASLHFAVCGREGATLSATDVVRVLSGRYPRVGRRRRPHDDDDVVRIAAGVIESCYSDGSSESPALELNLNSRAPIDMRRMLCGWLQRMPFMAPLLSLLLGWNTRQARQVSNWPLGPVEIAVLFLEHVQHLHRQTGAESSVLEADTFLWVSEYVPADMLTLYEQRAWAVDGWPEWAHPGQLTLSFFSCFLERTRHVHLLLRWPGQEEQPAPLLELRYGEQQLQDLRVAALRAYQQLCLDRHACALAEGMVSPHFRTAYFTLPTSAPEAPVGLVEQQFQALLGPASDGQVSVNLDTTRARPAMVIEMKGSREELDAAYALVQELRPRFAAQVRSRLLTNRWRGEKLLVEEEDNKQALFAQLRTRRVIIVCASTGSGKSTGIPKMLLQEATCLAPVRIICTQPRRVGATSLAQRICQQSGTLLGDDVGYHIGGAAEYRPGRTQLIYKTTAIAMTQVLQHPDKLPCTHLVIDEVQNRSVWDDVLMAAVKHRTLTTDPQLKVILMTAASDCETMSAYFADDQGPAPIVRMEGSPYKIEELCRDEITSLCFSRERQLTEADWALFIWHLHLRKRIESKFLVFLPGRGDIRKLRGELELLQEDEEENGGKRLFDIKALHGGLVVEQQQQLFVENTEGMRVVILATDVVESSVTIPAVDVVIDTCLQKRRRWNEDRREYELCVKHISKDEALQRRGRTGRVGPGEVYRLIERADFEKLECHTTAQMETQSISDILLLLSESPVVEGDPRVFLQSKMMSIPKPLQVEEAYTELLELGALERRSETGELTITVLGRFMQKLPLQPELGLLVWTGLRLGVLTECEIIAGVIQRGAPFTITPRRGSTPTPAEAVQANRVRRICHPGSDLLGGLRAYQAWSRFLNSREERGRPASAADEDAWCQQNHLSTTVLQEISELRLQIRESLAEMNLASPVPAEEQERVRTRCTRRQRLLSVRLGQRDPPDPFSWSFPAEEELSSLIPRHVEQDMQLRMASFCLGLAFTPNFVKVRSSSPDWKLIYKCHHRRVGQLANFLSQKLSLQVTGTPQNAWKKGHVSVAFSYPSDWQKAYQLSQAQLGRQAPYSHAPTIGRNATYEPVACCKASDIVLAADSICFPVVEPCIAVVGASLLLAEAAKGSGTKAILAMLTTLPENLLPALVAVRADKLPVEGPKHGGSEAEPCEVDDEGFQGCKVSANLRGEQETQLVSWKIIGPIRCLREALSTSKAAAENVDVARRAADFVLRHAESQRSERRLVYTLPEIRPDQHGLLIGEQGKNIQALRRRYPSVRIDIPKKGDTSALIRLEGPEEAVTSLRAEMLQSAHVTGAFPHGRRASAGQPGGRPRWRGGGGQREGDWKGKRRDSAPPRP